MSAAKNAPVNNQKSPDADAVDAGQFHAALFQMQRLAGLGVLTASVAHELNSPVSVITNSCNNLLSRVADDTLDMDQLLHYVTLVDHNAWRCARIIQTLLTYTRQESALVKADLNQLIEDAIMLVRRQFNQGYNVDLLTDLAGDLPHVQCDSNQIIQVLVNLLVNARDALAPRGGIVQIRSWPADGESVAFSVSDNGPGVAGELKDKIFEPFFTTKEAGQGTGLGLFISRAIVERHGGTIEISQRNGGGAVFLVTIPCS